MRSNSFLIVLSAILLPQAALGSEDNTALQMQNHLDEAIRSAAQLEGLVRSRPPSEGPAPEHTRLAQSDDSVNDEQRQQQDYVRSVVREAAETPPPAVVPPSSDVTGATPEEAAPGPARGKRKWRADEIRGIVSDAVAVPHREQPEEEELRASREQQRRQRVHDVVVNAPPPKAPASEHYISVLKDEVSTTVVIEDENTLHEPAPAGSWASKAREDKVYDLYTVRLGDSLWTVAESLAGDGYEWVALFEANRDTVSNADVLTVGQVLRIPTAWARR